MLGEAEDHEEGLDRDLDNSFTEESCSKEDAEWYEEMTAEESSQVEKRVRDL